MSAEAFAAVAAIVLSLLFSYVPGFASWYQPLDANLKRILMFGLMVLVAIGAFSLSCLALLDVDIACTAQGAFGLVKILVTALVVNQTTFLVSPKVGRNDPVWKQKHEAHEGSPGKPRGWQNPKK